VYRPSQKNILRLPLMLREREKGREGERTFIARKGKSAKILSSYVMGLYDGTTQLRRDQGN